MKKIMFFAVLLFASMAFGAGEFDQIGGVIDSFDKQVSSTSGMGLRTFMAWIPLILFIVGMVLSIKFSKKQAEQDQDNLKVFVQVALGAIGGAIVGVLIDSLIGAFLMQDYAKGLQVLKDYWMKALGL